MNLLEPASAESLYQNRGALEESLLNTSKLLESLDKNNRFDDVGEYNYLLTGMEGLLGQFSENHHELHHEIKEIMESSRMGLLTHEKLVEMVTAEQLRSQYLSNIVGSLKDQIENLFTTILTAVENRNGNDPEDLIDQVSTNVNLMWKSVESMSKVISSPTKRLDQTIRKIDSEVVVHLSKSVQQNDGKKEGFAEKLDKRLQKARINEEKRRHKLLESDSESMPNSSRQDGRSSGHNEVHSSRRHEDDSFGSHKAGGGATESSTPRNRHRDPHHTDGVQATTVDGVVTSRSAASSKSPSKNGGGASSASARGGDGAGDEVDAQSSVTISKKKDKHRHRKDKGDRDGRRSANGQGGDDSLIFDDNSSLEAGSLADSVDRWQGNDSFDDESVSRGVESGRSSHHHKKHKKASRKDRRSIDGELPSGGGGEDGDSERNSRRPSFDDASEITKSSRHKRRTSKEKRPTSNDNDYVSSSAANDVFTSRLLEEKKKWEKEKKDWQRAYEAKTLVETQRTIYGTVVPMLDLHNINSEEYQKILHSLTTDADSGRLYNFATQLSAQQQQQFGPSTLRLASFSGPALSGSSRGTGVNSAYNDSASGTPFDVSRPLTSFRTGSTPMAASGSNTSTANGIAAMGSINGNGNNDLSGSQTGHGVTNNTTASGAPTSATDAEPSLHNLSNMWNTMDTEHRNLLFALSNGLLTSFANNKGTNGKTGGGVGGGGSVGLQQWSSVIDHDRLIQFLQEQLSHWSNGGGDEDKKKLQRSNSESRLRGKLRRQGSSVNSPGSGGLSRSPSSLGRPGSRSDDDNWSVDSQNQRRPSRRLSMKSPSKASPEKKPTSAKLHSNGRHAYAHLGVTHDMAVQGKKTQKPMTQFLDEQAYHIGQLVRSHLQREGIHDVAYYAVVTDFIQRVLVNATRTHGDTGLKHGDTEHLAKSLELIKISLPDKYKDPRHAKTCEAGVNTELVMGAASSSMTAAGMSIQGNGLMTTTTTVNTVMVNGTPMTAPTSATSGVAGVGVGTGGWELPVFDNQANILITRTYRPPEKKAEFLELLQQHTDPLKFLYDEFQPYLPKQDRLRLYFACLTTKERIEETKADQHIVHAPDRWMKTQDLVQDLRRSVLLLDDETKAMSVIMLDLENIIQEAVMVVKSARQHGKMRAVNVPPSHHHQASSSHGVPWIESMQGLPHEYGLPDFDDDLADEDEEGRGGGGGGGGGARSPSCRDPNHRPLSTAPPGTSSAAGHRRRDPLPRHQKYTIDDESIRLMESHLFDIQRLLGEMEARVLSANLQQLEYRAFFQTLQAAGTLELPSMLKEFSEVQQSFVVSQEIQGRLYEVQQRLLLCQDRCHRYALFQYIPPQFAQYASALMRGPSSAEAGGRMATTGGSPPMTGTNTASADRRHQRRHQSGGGGASSSSSSARHRSASFAAGPNSTGGCGGANSVEALWSSLNLHAYRQDPHIVALVHMIDDLQEDVQILEEEKEDLELEMLEVVKAKDRTPDAILFFSLMHDPSFVPNLQQLCLQMKQIRGFLDYSVHMDYVMLRKRLQVCMVLTPNIDKLVEKYGLMYKQWSHFRRNWFAERNLRGGSAESFTTCPLCYHSLVEGNTAAVATAGGGGGAHKASMTKTKTSRKRALQQEAAHGATNGSSGDAGGTTMSKQLGRAAASAAARQDEAMLAASGPSTKLMIGGGGLVNSTASIASNGSKRVTHSISLPMITAQR